MPLRQIVTARWSDPTPIIQLVNHYLAIAEEPEEYLRICVHEVIQNIENHAESPIGGVMCARYMSSAQQVRVAIVDRGIGICTTLKRQHADTTPENPLRRVLKGKVSAMSRPNNAGLGLCNLTSTDRILERRLCHHLRRCDCGGTGWFCAQVCQVTQQIPGDGSLLHASGAESR